MLARVWRKRNTPPLLMGLQVCTTTLCPSGGSSGNWTCFLNFFFFLVRAGFRVLVHHHHGKKHGAVQADLVPEKELRGLRRGMQAAEGDWIPH